MVWLWFGCGLGGGVGPDEGPLRAFGKGARLEDFARTPGELSLWRDVGGSSPSRAGSLFDSKKEPPLLGERGSVGFGFPLFIGGGGSGFCFGG